MTLEEKVSSLKSCEILEAETPKADAVCSAETPVPKRAIAFSSTEEGTPEACFPLPKGSSGAGVSAPRESKDISCESTEFIEEIILEVMVAAEGGIRKLP